VEAFVADLNGRLRASGTRRAEHTVQGDGDRELRRRGLLSVFKLHVEPTTTAETLHWRVRLTRDDDEWNRRRRTNGLNVLVAHPDLPQAAADIVALYFAKDAVEKDFQTIKSELDLRPVHHRTDDKVRAHVTLCILALLLERTLELQLAQVDLRMTAPRCLEILETCKLNLYAGQRGPVYSVTELTTDQTAILDALNMRPLADDAILAETIAPR
jgi:transposase